MSKATGFGGGGATNSFTADRKWDQSPAGVYSPNVLSYPTGNLASNGTRPVRQDNCTFYGSWTNLTHWAVSGSTVYARTTAAQISGTIYADSTSTTSETGWEISSSYGLHGIFYWSTVPAQMSAPTVTANTTVAGRLDVSYTAPDDGGDGISGYSVYVNGAWNHNTTSTSTSVTGLATGTSYNISVAAYNGVGTATQSAATARTTLAVPSAPGLGTITRVGRSVTVPVQTSSSNGGATITSYTVQYSEDNGSNWNQNNDAQTISGATGANVTFSNLTPALTYKFRALATNSIGSSSWTTSASFFLPAGGKRYNSATSQFIATNTAKRYDGATSQWKDINTAKRYSSATNSWVDLG